MQFFSIKIAPYLLLFIALFIGLASSAPVPCEPISNQDGETLYQCPSLHICANGYCMHKDIFPLTTTEIIGSISLMILAGLANAGGLGGGALLTPILLIFFQYSANKAIMLVYCIVFGGSLGNFLNVAFQRNPDTGKSYVNFDLSLICMPFMTLGAMAGILLNRVLPPIFIITGLIIVMIYSGRKVYAKAKSEYRSESSEREHPLLAPIKSPQSIEKDIELMSLDGSDRQDDVIDLGHPQLEAILEEDYQLFPPKKITLVVLLLLFIILTTMLRGSKDFGSLIGLDYCGSGYWLIYALTLFGCWMTYYMGAHVVNKQIAIKESFNYHEEGFQITPEVARTMKPLSLIAGILAGLLGLGGGMVMSPSLLQLGMEPQVLAGTVGFFVVQTSFVTLFQAVLYGDITGKELLFFLVLSFVGSYGVSWILTFIVRKYKRPSLILFTLSFVVILSLVVMPIFSLYKSIDRPEEMFTFHSLC